MTALMEGKRGLIMGVANDHSIAWGIAKTLAEHGATLDPAFSDMPIVRERRDDVKLGCVLSNSFGFGGTNASVVFKRLDA